MEKGKILTIEDRIPKLKEQRRQKANRRLIFYVSVFFLLISSILYLQSPLSHIAKIEVEGNIHVSTEEIITSSEVTNRTSIFNLQPEKVIKKIKKNKEIKEVVIEKKFPNTITINIVEMKRVAYAITEGSYFPIIEDGNVLQPVKMTNVPSDAPLLMNWEAGSELQEMASELSKLSSAIANSISEIHYTPNDTDSLHITLFMNDGHEVSATITDFAKKMSAYPSIVKQLDPSLKGIIHMEVAYYFESFESKEEVNIDESEG